MILGKVRQDLHEVVTQQDLEIFLSPGIIEKVGKDDLLLCGAQLLLVLVGERYGPGGSMNTLDVVQGAGVCLRNSIWASKGPCNFLS